MITRNTVLKTIHRILFLSSIAVIFYFQIVLKLDSVQMLLDYLMSDNGSIAVLAYFFTGTYSLYAFIFCLVDMFKNKRRNKVFWIIGILLFAVLVSTIYFEVYIYGNYFQSIEEEDYRS